MSGDSQVDGIAKAGLEGLSDYVNQRGNAATLFEPERGAARADRPEPVSAAGTGRSARTPPDLTMIQAAVLNSIDD